MLPPNVTEARFRKALNGFAAAVGREWVLSSDEDRNTYADAFAPGNAEQHAVSAGVAPKSVEEVQAVVRIANEHRIPLWTISTGRNLAYGGSAPVLRGSVVLDLKRMNRILEIDEELGYALVEPGVTFFDLYEKLKSGGHKLWMSMPAPGWGSVVGNALDHGLGYTPYGVHAEFICGMEVVLPDASVVRTGMGAIPGGREWQTFKLGYGPVWDGMFTQSNLGIVTKMGVWLQPAPEAMQNVEVHLPKEDDLAILVDTLRPLRLDDTINATYTIMNPYRGVMDTYTMSGRTRNAVYRGPGAMPMDVVKQELAKLGRGLWMVTTNLFDRNEGLDIRLRAIQQAFAKVPGARVETKRWHYGEARQAWMRSEPGLAALGSTDWYNGPGGHINYAPVVAPIGSRVAELYDAIYKRFMEYGIDCYAGMLNMGNRGLVINSVMFYDKTDADLTRRARELFAVLAKDGAALGHGDYRAHISFMDHVAETYSFNDHALRRLNERVKDALDPNGILSPGKQGIWPRDFRKR